MTGPAAYSRDADIASVARADLDRAAEAMEWVDVAHRAAVEALVALWPSSAWLAAGLRTAKQWLVAHTGVSWSTADRLERIAARCAAHPTLADAVVSGRLPFRRAELLGRVVTDERAPFLGGSLESILQLGCSTADDDAFRSALTYWAARVDEFVAPRREQPHALTLTPRLFGGGQIHGDLAPVAFDTISTAIDAWLQPPDPADAPHVRTLAERQADALDDIAIFSITHRDDDDLDGDRLDDDEEFPVDDPARACGDDSGDGFDDCIDWDEIRAADTFDGTAPTDVLDELLAAAEAADPVDEEPDPALLELDALRRRLRRTELHRRRRVRRRVRARSGVTINAHVDIRTLLGLRDIDDFEGLVLRGEGWALARAALDRYRCDSSLVATLFAGQKRVLDANTATEQFNHSQRRAIAARDRCCVFPGCTARPRRCDVHHLEERSDGGPTSTSNGCLLCRFHHRLLHEYRWRLEQEPDGTWVATDPRGRRWSCRRPAHQRAA